MVGERGGGTLEAAAELPLDTATRKELSKHADYKLTQSDVDILCQFPPKLNC